MLVHSSQRSSDCVRELVVCIYFREISRYEIKGVKFAVPYPTLKVVHWGILDLIYPRVQLGVPRQPRQDGESVCQRARCVYSL